jgi:hypothetical protein
MRLSDVYFDQGCAILKRRKTIKQNTIEPRRLRHLKAAASFVEQSFLFEQA